MLRAMGTPHHLGPVGMGETVKLVNQIIIANVMIANAEGLVFAQRAGADLGRVRAVLASATASNYLLARMVAEDVACRKVRGRIRARSPSQGPRGRTRCRARRWTIRCRPRGWRINSTLLAPLKGTARWITAR